MPRAPGRPARPRVPGARAPARPADVAVIGALDPLAACLVEAAWSVRLPAIFNRSHGTYSVELSDR